MSGRVFAHVAAYAFPRGWGLGLQCGYEGERVMGLFENLAGLAVVGGLLLYGAVSYYIIRRLVRRKR